jgi:hypothetical protein
VAPSESCRAWRPVAQELMYSRQRFSKGRGIEQFVCGFHLQSLVFGLGSVSINRLEIESVGKEYIHILARSVAHSLSSLHLDFMSDDGDEAFLSSVDCYAILEGVFHHCRRIRTLSLRGFDFGIDPDIISPPIKEGFSRLTKLGIDYCIGDIPIFINQTPIPNLQTIKCCSGLLPDFEYAIVNAISSNYRTLVDFDLSGLYTSSSNVLMIVECIMLSVCRENYINPRLGIATF